MKIALLLSLISFVSASAFANDWIVLKRSQQKILKNDACAQAAVDAAASVLADEIQDAGTDMPDQIHLLDLQVSEPGAVYGVTFEESATMIVETHMRGSKCVAKKPSPIRIEPRLSGGN